MISIPAAQNARWLPLIADVGYDFLLWLNRPLNFLRRIFGLGYWSSSSHAKQKVKSAVNDVGEIRESHRAFWS